MFRMTYDNTFQFHEANTVPHSRPSTVRRIKYPATRCHFRRRPRFCIRESSAERRLLFSTNDPKSVNNRDVDESGLSSSHQGGTIQHFYNLPRLKSVHISWCLATEDRRRGRTATKRRLRSPKYTPHATKTRCHCVLSRDYHIRSVFRLQATRKAGTTDREQTGTTAGASIHDAPNGPKDATEM
jgi:hypothetical protein